MAGDLACDDFYLPTVFWHLRKERAEHRAGACSQDRRWRVAPA